MVFAETRIVGAGGYPTIQAALDAAQNGDRILVKGGVHLGPLVVDKSVEMVGEDFPVINGGGKGTVVRLTAPHTVFKGFVVKGSGDLLAQEDTGLIAEAEDEVIESNRFENVLFGVYLHKSPRSVIRKNSLKGKSLDIARRGDLIRIWYSDGATVEDNVSDGGRDAVLWFSKGLRVSGNRFTHSRYGLHFMYCKDAIVENNILEGNSVGAYLMYSHELILRKNSLSDNRGPSGSGIGFKDMEKATIEDNIVVNNRVGFFLDGSSESICRRNLVAYNDTGFQVFPTVRHNRFESNNIIDNVEQAALDSQSVYTVNEWVSNYWSDYRGFDLAGDGVGDIPYRPMKLFERLSDRFHLLRIFSGGPSVAAIDFAATTFPVFQPATKLSDDKPRMSPIQPSFFPGKRSVSMPWILVALAFLSPVFVTGYWTGRKASS